MRFASDTGVPVGIGVLLLERKVEFPQRFLQAMVQDKRAMQAYAALKREERERLLSQASLASTKADIDAIVLSLYESTSAVEFS